MKKKVCWILAVVLLVCIVPAAAFAADASASPSAAPAGLLSIDNGNVYAGMAKSYSQGYVPGINTGTATVVFPLVSSGNILNNTIKINVGLGDASSSPFVFGNYDQTIGLQNNPVNNGASTVPSYLVTLTLPMVDSRIMGRYPVTITANYTAADGTVLSQAFAVYVTVSDGKDPNATPTPSPTPSPTEAPLPQPKIIIKSHTLNPGDVLAGSTFDLDITLLNTSDGQSVQNITVTAKGETTDLIPLEDTGSAFIKRISGGKTAEFHTKMQVRQDAKAGAQKVLLGVEYENGKAAAFTENYEIIVQISQPIRLEYDKPSIPENVNAGDTISIALNLMNMGKSTLYNVRCSLSAPGLIPEGSAYLGNMDAGTSKSGDINVFIGTLDMASDSGQTALPSPEVKGEATPEGKPAALPAAEAAPAAAPVAAAAPAVAAKQAAIAIAGNGPAMIAPAGSGQPVLPDAQGGGSYGPTQGKITITYEDQNGKEYNEEIDISTTIGPPVIPVMGSQNPDDVKPPDTVSQWWVSVLIAGGIAAGLIVFLRLRIRRKRKALLEDGNEDE